MAAYIELLRATQSDMCIVDQIIIGKLFHAQAELEFVTWVERVNIRTMLIMSYDW
jgi:hypothetical protein